MGSSLQNNSKMKFLLVLCIALTVAQAATTRDTCQFERNTIEKLAKDISARTQVQPKGDGECSDGEGFGCIGEILGTVMSCIAGRHEPRGRVHLRHRSHQRRQRLLRLHLLGHELRWN